MIVPGVHDRTAPKACTELNQGGDGTNHVAFAKGAGWPYEPGSPRWSNAASGRYIDKAVSHGLKTFLSIIRDKAMTKETRRTSIVQALGHECALNVKSDTVSRPSNDVDTVPSLRNSTVAAHRVTRPGGFPITYPSREVDRSRRKAISQRQTDLYKTDGSRPSRAYTYYRCVTSSNSTTNNDRPCKPLSFTSFGY